MRICIPTADDKGLAGLVHGHFGSAPFFTLVDEDGGNLKIIANRNEHHQHGQCTPMSQLSGEEFDAVVVAGMGRRAMETIQAAGRRVLKAQGPTVQDNVDSLKAGKLQAMATTHACEGHH